MQTAIRVDRSLPGIRVVTEHLPWCHSAAVGIWIGSGSAEERPEEHGAAHFLEHVLFKRTATASGRELSERIDLLGGDLNAYTGREHTCYHVHVPADGLADAVDVLTDVVANGLCHPEDVEVERDVVLDELAGRADDPEDLACELSATAVLGVDPLARAIIGTEESVAALDAATLSAFHRRILRSGNVVVAAAGRVDHEALMQWIADGPLPTAVGRVESAVDAASGASMVYCAHTVNGVASQASATDYGWATEPVVTGQDEESEQVLFALTRRTPARDHRDRAAAQIAVAVLGGGLSSRLFQRIREDLGLAYSVYASMDQFRRTGLVSVVAGCAAGRADELGDEIRRVVAGMAANPPTGGEVDRAIGHLTGSIRLGLDDPLSRMARIGRHLLDRDTVVPVSESMGRLLAVTREDVVGYWNGESSPWCLAAVGPGMPHSGAAGLIAGLCR